MKKIVIVGGGFGGIKVALDLEKQKLPDTQIVLVHNKYHFEYHGALYRTVTGRSPLEVCIPLGEIFKGKNVQVIEDAITDISIKEVTSRGDDGHEVYTRVYTLKGMTETESMCDYLVLALGMETNYFDIPGLKEHSFGFKTVQDALRLKRHLHEVFEKYANAQHELKKSACHIVVVGAGASGVEAAGDLSWYARQLAASHGIDPSLVTIDLIEAKNRILPSMPKAFSQRIEKRLQQLGVNIYTNKTVIKEDVERLYMKSMQMKTKTVIWTAGVRANALYKKLDMSSYDALGRVSVDEYFQPMGIDNMFIVGDGAATEQSGMAQTALTNAQYVARIISGRIQGKQDINMKPYSSQEIIYPIPVGPRWAGVLWGKKMMFGRMGWFLRRYFDLKVFLLFLPVAKAIQAFRESGVVCETCEKCLDAHKDVHRAS